MSDVRLGAASEWRVEESGSGDPLILVHGLGTDSTAWSRVAPLLAHRFRVIAVDLPGYALNSSVHSVPHADDLAIGLEALLARMDIASAVFVGHSFGGAVSLLTAHHFPTRCAGLALIAPGGFGVELNPVVPFMGTRAGARLLRALYSPRASRTIERIAARVESNSESGRVRVSELMETYDRLRTEQAREQFQASVRESLALNADIDRTQIVDQLAHPDPRHVGTRGSRAAAVAGEERDVDASVEPDPLAGRSRAHAAPQRARHGGARNRGIRRFRRGAATARVAAAARRLTQPATKLRRTSRTALSTFVSTRQIDCHVPSVIRPSSTGTTSDGATKAGST